MSQCWMKEACREQLWSVESQAHTQQWGGTWEAASIQPDAPPHLSYSQGRMRAWVWYVVYTCFMRLLG